MKSDMSLSEEERVAEFIALDAKLTAHLAGGGSTEDAPVTEWIERMVTLGMQLQWVQPILESMPLARSWLARAYRESLEMLMPNPLVQTENGPRLVPSLLYLDPDVLPNLVSRQGERLGVAVRSEDFEEALVVLRQESQRLYRRFTAGKSPVPLATDESGGLGGQGGCASISLRLCVLLAGGAGGLGVVVWWLA